MTDPATTLKRLAPRRGCLEAALADCRELRDTDTDDSPQGTWRRAVLGARIQLLELALRQWDQAMRGEEPEPAP